MGIVAERLTTEVRADTSQAEKALDGFSKKGSSAFGWVGAAKAAVVGLAGTAAVAFAGKMVNAAADYNETISKVGQVYGDQQQKVLDYAQQQADAFGLPKTAILDAASSFGLLGNAAGLAQSASADMSTQLAGLAADAASFYNVPLEEALQSIQSGLVGEAEPMRRFGVLMNEAAVQAKALALGLVAPVQNTAELANAQTGARLAQDKYTAAVKKHGKDSAEAERAGLALAKANDAVAKAAEGTVPALTEAQKVQARAALITEGMATASGDLERTQASFSNRLREVRGRVLNYATDLGQKLLPAATAVLNGLIALPAALQTVRGYLEDNQTAILATAGVITAVFLPAMIRSGVVAVASGAQVVAAWVAARVAAMASAAAQWAALARTIAGWVAAGAAAVASGAQTVAIWALYRAEAIRGAAASVAAHARVVAGWVAAGAAAAAGAARTVAGWVVAGAAAVAQGAVMVASMAVTAASVVAGWVLMGVQAMAQAARMAAAWFIALGPIGWVTAAVIGLVALVVANWDTVSRVTAQVWDAIVGWVTDAWDAIVERVTRMVGNVRRNIEQAFQFILTIVTMYVNAWRTVITAVWSAIVAVVRTYVGLVQSVIGGLAAIAGRVRAWFDQARAAIADRLSAAVEFVRGVPARIVAALGNAGRLLYDAGARIIGGLADGIRSAVGKVTGAVSNVMERVRDFLPFSPAKRGPFSGKGWSGYSGAAIARDLAAGMVGNVNAVKRAGNVVASAAAVNLPGMSVGGVTGTTNRPTAARAALDATGVTAARAASGPTTLVFVDADGNLIGRMQAEAGRVYTGGVTPLDHGRATW